MLRVYRSSSAAEKVICLSLAMALGTFVGGGAMSNHLDISTQLSGVLYGTSYVTWSVCR
jgi:hypothetical protein|eukprot:COSAG01_NODE_825_length_13294_cov_30.659038_7_plen_59_part_00